MRILRILGVGRAAVDLEIELRIRRAGDWWEFPEYLVVRFEDGRCLRAKAPPRVRCGEKADLLGPWEPVDSPPEIHGEVVRTLRGGGIVNFGKDFLEFRRRIPQYRRIQYRPILQNRRIPRNVTFPDGTILREPMDHRADPEAISTFETLQQGDLVLLISVTSREIFEIFQTTEGIELWVNPTTSTLSHVDRDLIFQVLRRAQWVVLNETEASLLIGNSSSWREALTEIPGTNVIVTLGAKGLGFRFGRRVGHLPAFEVTPSHTSVGAGDAFLAGLVLGYLRSLEGESLLNWTQAFPALHLTRLGRAPVTPELLEEFLSQRGFHNGVTSLDDCAEGLRPPLHGGLAGPVTD